MLHSLVRVTRRDKKGKLLTRGVATSSKTAIGGKGTKSEKVKVNFLIGSS